MRKSIYIALAAIALLSAASCQKEDITSADADKAQVRTVTVAFENSVTKTTLSLDGRTPLWSEGDEILILDGTSSQKVTLTSAMMIDSCTAAFSTTLTGDVLYAVYPASATTMTSCSGSVNFIVPAEQDGSFASANICVAKGIADADDNVGLVFSNVTSVMEFTQSSSITKIGRVQMRAANPISGTLTASFDNNDKVNSIQWAASGAEAHTIVAAPGALKDTIFMAVAPVATGEMEFKYSKSPEAYPANVAVESYTTKNLERNKIYGGANLSMDSKTYGLDYVTIDSLVWTADNLAQSESGKSDFNGTLHTNGDYFEWGSSVILEGDWRMPKYNEFNALINATHWEWDGDDKGYYIYIPSSVYYKTDALMFLPAAGYDNESALSGVGDVGYYWSSSLGSVDGRAYGLIISEDGQVVISNNLDCNSHYSIRPVSGILPQDKKPTETNPESTLF